MSLDIKHVFLISNPVVAIVAFEYISRNRFMNKSNVEIIYFRNNTYDIFEGFSEHSVNRNIFNRVAVRCRFFTVFPVSVRNYIESLADKFELYSSWLDSVSSEVVKSTSCLCHSYLEEGEQSYKDLAVATFDSSYRQPRKTENVYYRYDHYWRSDAVEWISIFPEAFPSAPDGRLHILGELNHVKSNYSPRLKSGDTILLMPTPGRIPLDYLNFVLEKLSWHCSGAAFLKLHPGFYENKRYLRKVLSLISDKRFSDIKILPPTIILEAEMLFNKLHFVGDRSSVLIYAEKFGSDITRIPFLHGEFY